MGNSKTKPKSNSAKNSPVITKKPLDTSSNDSEGWQWQDDSNWKAYDQETTDIIEQAYNDGTTSLMLTHGFFGQQGNYSISLARFEQTKNATGFVRKIRRNPAVSPLLDDFSDNIPSAPDVILEDNAQTSDGSPAWYFKVHFFSRR